VGWLTTRVSAGDEGYETTQQWRPWRRWAASQRKLSPSCAYPSCYHSGAASAAASDVVVDAAVAGTVGSQIQTQSRAA
jgi:hypothetical protein